MTWHELIDNALLLLNISAIGDSISAEEMQATKTTLNMMLDSWNNQHASLYYVVNSSFSLTANDGSYTIGPSGADLTATRPLRIDSAFTRLPGQANPVDYQMSQLTNQQYQDLILKNVGTSYPTHYLYTPTFPNGTLYLYPVPSVTLELHLSMWQQLIQVTALTDSISLPPGYARAILYNLAYELAPYYGRELGMSHPITMTAKNSLDVIKTVNAEPGIAKIDQSLVINSRDFNIFAGM